MIGFLSGKVLEIYSDYLLLIVSGVGYQVSIGASLARALTVAQGLDLYIYTHVREDALELYGFKNEKELAMFKLLLGVSGIGPKTAMTVIDRGVEQVSDAVTKADVSFFTMVPRLGQKNAQKIIIELKNKLGGIKELDLRDVSGATQEAIDALKAMGYKHSEAVAAMRQVPAELVSVEEKIRSALMRMGGQ